MPRFFYTSNASRPYSAGGLSFVFEVVGSVAMQRVGILEVHDEKAADALLAKKIPAIREISAAEFAELKKNASPSSVSWLVSPRGQRPVSPPAPVVPPVASPPVFTEATSPAPAEPGDIGDIFADMPAAPAEPPPDLPPDPAAGKRGKRGNK